MSFDFKSYLLKKAVIKEKYVPFYFKWISECYSFLNQSDYRILTSEEKQKFLKHLSKTHEDWQIKQAASEWKKYQALKCE